MVLRGATVGVWERLKEIDMFFAESSPVHDSMRRFVERLRAAGIPYLVMGGMAVNAHGAKRTTSDLDVLLSATGLEWFRAELLGKEYDLRGKHPRKFRDRANSVDVDLLQAGHKPGRPDRAPPFDFPDPATVGEEIDGIRYPTLAELIQFKIGSGRYTDLGDVVFLIRVHDLDEAFTGKLHPWTHSDFIECLEEKRREDEYEAQQ